MQDEKKKAAEPSAAEKKEAFANIVYESKYKFTYKYLVIN